MLDRGDSFGGRVLVCQDAPVADDLTLADIEAASQRLEGVVRRLPVHSAR